MHCSYWRIWLREHATAETYLNYSPIPITDLIGPKGKNQITMADLKPAQVKDYACEDADVTLRLKYYFEPLLQEQGIHTLRQAREAAEQTYYARLKY